MKLLIFSGILYLIGISIILIIKPELMFTENGVWKEFGIGRDRNRYTWMPFWLFAIMWSIISYIIVLVLYDTTSRNISNVSNLSMYDNEELTPNIEKVNALPGYENIKNNSSLKRKYSVDMKSGYYILNAEETLKKGIPKYIYLGPETPNVLYKE
jgi:hypothetical protein